jgi:hypothetical protein
MPASRQCSVRDWHSLSLSPPNGNPAKRRTSPLAGQAPLPARVVRRNFYGLLARSHHVEVGPLSRGVTSEPLSGPLQPDLRFFHDPLPAHPTASLAIGLPINPWANIRAYPVPHRQHEQVRSCLSTGGASRRRVPLQDWDIRPHTVLVRAYFAASAQL